MEIITLEISIEDYKKLPAWVTELMDIKKVEPKDFDYSFDKEWSELNEKAKEGMKVYKKLKKREYEIRKGL